MEDWKDPLNLAATNWWQELGWLYQDGVFTGCLVKKIKIIISQRDT